MKHTIYSLLFLVFVLSIIPSILISQSKIGRDICNDNRCGFINRLNIFNQKKEYNDRILVDNRPVCQKAYPSPSGRYLIHYDTSGHDAVSPIDNNHNGIPDYVDSVAFYIDYVYHVEVEELGFPTPLSDNGVGGSDAYDIYILNTGDPDGFYGETVPEQNFINGHKYPPFTTYLTIDNDYSPNDINSSNNKPSFYITGYDAMKVTLAHEHFHAIQSVYGIPLPSCATIMEMTAVWMEHRVFPEIRDYLQYVRSLFKNLDLYSFGVPDGENGYRYTLFCHYLYATYGDTILKRYWEVTNGNLEAYEGMDSTLKEFGSSLPLAWSKFMTWIYYTGKRAVPGEYFVDAALMPEITFNPEYNDSSTTSIYSGNVGAFGLRASRFIFPGEKFSTNDTLDVILANIDYNSVKGTLFEDPPSRSFSIAATNKEQTGFDYIPEIGYYFLFQPENNLIIDSIFANAGKITQAIGHAYPNPFDPNHDGALYFPTPAKLNVYDKVSLKIYNTGMVCIYDNGKEQVSSNNGHRVVEWKDYPDLSSGVYIYTIGYNGNTEIGKFAVVRK